MDIRTWFYWRRRDAVAALKSLWFWLGFAIEGLLWFVGMVLLFFTIERML